MPLRAPLEPGVLQMADGDRKRVGGVVGPRHSGQAEQDADHLLHLAFLGTAVGRHSLLDFLGRVLAHAQAGLGQRQHDYATRFADDRRRRHIPLEEQSLDSGRLGLV